jgi:hypothetical protein
VGIPTRSPHPYPYPEFASFFPDGTPQFIHSSFVLPLIFPHTFPPHRSKTQIPRGNLKDSPATHTSPIYRHAELQAQHNITYPTWNPPFQFHYLVCVTCKCHTKSYPALPTFAPQLHIPRIPVFTLSNLKNTCRVFFPTQSYLTFYYPRLIHTRDRASPTNTGTLSLPTLRRTHTCTYSGMLIQSNSSEVALDPTPHLHIQTPTCPKAPKVAIILNSQFRSTSTPQLCLEIRQVRIEFLFTISYSSYISTRYICFAP